MHPETFLRVIGPRHWNVAYVQPSRRPADGRFGENPNRLFKHHQFQVILKPSPDDAQRVYLDSLEACGIDPARHDIRFEEDNWESPTLGAWGIGWQVLLDGLEITQFTYFQQAGGMDLAPISVELTYGLERIAMHLQGVDDVYDLAWAPGVSYRRGCGIARKWNSRSTPSARSTCRPGANSGGCTATCLTVTTTLGERLLASGLTLPALDHCLKCSHAFNLLDASGSHRRDRAGCLHPARPEAGRRHCRGRTPSGSVSQAAGAAAVAKAADA